VEANKERLSIKWKARWLAKPEDARRNSRKHYRKVAEIEGATGEQKVGACEICQKECKLCLDHDHATGRIRGWLCFKCNTALGKLGDTVAGLERAIAYLKKANENV
jgi:hypothetical protein